MSDYSHIDGARDIVRAECFSKIKEHLKAVVFDLDGTLTDSVGQIIACTHHTFDFYKIRQPDDKAIMSTIGKELSEALCILLPDEYKHLKVQFTKDYREIFSAHKEYQIDKVFPGVEELVKKLREHNIKIGYASGRSETGIKRTLDATFLGDYCDAICAGSEVPSKPEPMMMYKVCSRLNVSEKDTLGVGDSGLDIKMYQNASSMSLGVQTGVWSGEALLTLNPDMLLKSIGDLTSYL